MFRNRTFKVLSSLILMITLCTGQVTAAPNNGINEVKRNPSSSSVHNDLSFVSDFTYQASSPPYSGTSYLSSNIITSADPTSFIDAVYSGRGMRTMFDRRTNGWVTVNAYLFNARYIGGFKIEIQVNPEFGTESAANVEAQKYGWLVGQLPAVLRKDVKMLWIHKGNQDFGGGNNSILIHTARATSYGDFLEEILIHEAAHTSLDAKHANSPNWLAAQTADNSFISIYARDFPDREDVAESFLVYLAVRYKKDRIPIADVNVILQTIPNRISYFDKQIFDLYPLAPTLSLKSIGAQDGWVLESGETSNQGGTLNQMDTILQIGDDASKKQYMAILSFKTASLPDDAIITKVTLRVRQQDILGGGNPVNTFRGFMIDIKRGSFNAPGLAVNDFQAPAQKTIGPLNKNANVSGWYVLNLNASKNFINKLATNNGLTQIRLRFNLDDNNNNIANILQLFSGNAGATNRPQLIIEYYVP